MTFISCLEEGRSLDPAVVEAGEERVVVVCRAGEEGDNAPSTLNLTIYRVAEVGGGGDVGTLQIETLESRTPSIL